MNIQQQLQCHYLGIQNSFEKALVSYDDAAVVQGQVGRVLVDCLAKYKPHHQKVLDLGCGTGLTTLHLYKRFPMASLHINDFSPLLLKATCERLRAVHAKPCLFNFDQPWDCGGLYDLIFSNMAFQWSFDIDELLKNCFNHLKQNGILAFSLPLRGSFSEINPHRRISLHSLDYIVEIIGKIGFSLLKVNSFLQRQTFKTKLQSLQSIKRCGANYVPHQSYKMLDRSTLSLPSTLTYKIGMFIVQKRSS